ncbi:MAG: trigger factor [Sulfurimonas sp.]|nr:trigger factor [Sulfurimonas sp.]
MEIKSNQTNGANAVIEAVIYKKVIDSYIDKIAKEYAKSANVQGFRKGKVPVAVIKQQHGDKLVQDAEAEALREVLSKGLEQMGISNESLIGEPNISKFDKSDDKIEVAVKIAMRPKIDLGDYASYAKEFTKPKVKAADVTTRIKELAQSQAPVVDIKKNRKLKEGDTAVLDFEGFLDGKNFEGGAASNFELVIGSAQFINGFEDQLVGAKRDEEVEVNVTFPEDYQGKELAGKDVVFKVKVVGIKEKQKVEIDDELAKKFLPDNKEATVDVLKEQIKAQMENEAMTKLYAEELKPALLETLVSSMEFDLPEFVIEQEIDLSLNKKAQSMSEDEIKELRENVEKLKELRDTFREDATQSVKATFIIDALANKMALKVDEQEVMQTIYLEAMQTGQDPKKTYEQYKDAGYIPAIQMSMVEDKVLSRILDAKMK